MFDGFKVDLICEARGQNADACHVTVKSGGAFLLRIINGHQTVEKKILPGSQDFSL